jgi:hypothetical protein
MAGAVEFDISEHSANIGDYDCQNMIVKIMFKNR